MDVLHGFPGEPSLVCGAIAGHVAVELRVQYDDSFGLRNVPVCRVAAL